MSTSYHESLGEALAGVGSESGKVFNASIELFQVSILPLIGPAAIKDRE